ncbi:MAG: sulfite exporter TauE/SafE family protein [Saprospiraceae bacterium]
MILWTAFTIGLFGSVHCVGMCGPIALTVGSQKQGSLLGRAVLYNLGRIATYALLGLIIGLIGKGLFIAGFQKYLVIALGVALLLIALLSINVENRLLALPVVEKFYFGLKTRLGRTLKSTSPLAPLGIGIINGFLPCGLVYLAIAGAVSTAGVVEGAAYMALFGLGTWPVMLTSVFFGNMLSLRLRNFLKKLYPAFLVFFAILFLARGFNFHIPGEFFFWDQMDNLPMCH